MHCNERMVYMEIILCVILSVLASMIATKIQTMKYFDVIDQYVKGLLDDTKESITDTVNSIRDATGGK